MHKPCLFLLLFTCLAASAQKRIDIDAGCAFNTDAKNTRPYVFDADPQAQQIVGDVCRAIGITQRFQLQSADVKNALACERNGTRYILYNPDFLKDIQTDARTKWAAYGVLAHEIGHHVNGDHFDEPDSERRKELELEADRFAGSALRLMGATKDEAKSTVASLFNQDETNTHPPARARNASVVNGWNDQDTRLRNMGVTGVNDPGNTSATRTVVRDRDGDGVPDGQDACPDVPGEAILNGCPDADGDGITDDADECPYKKGEGRWKGCPDSDADGIPDNKDKCPYVYGELKDNGCPPPDDDLDGIPNSADRCPQLAGTARYRGCPDTDGDGVPDPDDKCPNEKGDPTYEGCLAPTRPAAPNTTAPASNTALQQLMGNRKSGLLMKTVEGGTYTMGSPTTESGRDADECQHSETVRSFKIGVYEVTQADWQAVMGSNPSNFKNCPDCPVESVSWDDIQQFITKLKEKTGLPFRLPTEVEWEYAARGGKQSKGYLYAGGNTLNEVAWNYNNSDKKTHPVGGKQANELGLYDMSGNVWEWCQDTYKPYSCDSKTSADSSVRVLRGGSWVNFNSSNLRVAERFNYAPDRRLWLPIGPGLNITLFTFTLLTSRA
ncbi:MAG: SUMF1/EgtB/PvdO family nonheme iron enzyme [Bacteroidetes bacterium]|nr:SUMF1/EgtB/PvdO family nonheme iron enzyme [Bacteroidota bacterium]